MKNNRIIKRSVLCFFIIFFYLLVCFFVPFKDAYVKADTCETVKVGWYQSNNFQEGTIDGEKSGYCYEYLQKIANYNTWSYEYIEGDWTTLLGKLISGEIDVLAGVSKTTEREAYIAYPSYEMGNEAYCIFQHTNNKTMSISDLSSFSGKRIGAISNSTMTDYLEAWNSSNHANLDIVYYTDFTERDNDFLNNQLDGIVGTDNNVNDSSAYSLVTKVGEDPYYLAVNKSKTSLLAELNESLAILQDIEPFFLQNLQYEFFGSKIVNSSKSDIEIAWLNNHSVLNIGYLDNYLPYCGKGEDGNVSGLITDVMSAIVEELDLKDSLSIHYISYKNYDLMIEALKNHEIDTAFPVSGSAWNLEQDGIDASNIIVASGMNLIYREKYDLNDHGTFAVNRNNKLQAYYVNNVFPNSKIVEYDSIYECLDAVLKGDVKYTIVNGLRVHIYTENNKYEALSSIQLQRKDNRYFGVNHEDVGLLLLLNRGINLIGSEFGINASYSYIESNNQFSLSSFLRTYIYHIFAAIFVFAVIVAVLFVLYFRHNKKVQNIIKSSLEENKLLTNALENKNAMLEEKINEVQKANEYKTSFLNNMSHDIRTPMNAILGFNELIARKKDNPKQVEDYVNKIRVSGDYLLSIINNVLDMARIESGKVEVDEDLFDLDFDKDNNLIAVQEVAKKNQEIIVSKSIQHRYVLTDGQKVQEIIMNLVSNAVKYSPEDGRIELSIVEKESEKEGCGNYIFTVKDNGLGMSEEFVKHIFDPFVREKNTTESKVIGTGLGMSIVKKLVELLDGSIEIESELHRGSTFRVSFDFKIVEDPSLFSKNDKLGEGSLDHLKGKRFLVVEDNEFNAEITMTILEEAGFAVERACDGIECLNALYHHDAKYFDLILMDIQMPNLDGYETTKSIRLLEDKEKASIPIIATTANAFEEDKRKCLEVGMNGHLAKPIDISELMKSLSEILK